MNIIAIDGATRNPGKPNCLAVGAVFSNMSGELGFRLRAEDESTSQRGELHALIEALQCMSGEDEVYLVTDSEYIYNSLSKKWYENWVIKGFKNAEGEPLKNSDLWKVIIVQLGNLELNGTEVLPYHIKGHVFSFGKVAAKRLLEQEDGVDKLRDAVRLKMGHDWAKKQDKVEHALEVFEKNHGYAPPMDVFKEMLVANIVVDLIAGYTADNIMTSRSN